MPEDRLFQTASAAVVKVGLATAHTGGQTDTVAERLAALVAEQVRRMQAGEPLKNIVNPELGY